MKSTVFSLVLITLASSYCCRGYSETSVLFDYPVIDLTNGKNLFFQPNNKQAQADNKLTAVLFFEPDCGWCFKQTRVFNQFQKNCAGDVQFVGLGVNGSRQQIKKEIWRQRTNFPMYMASKEMIKAIGRVATTPLTLLLDRSGNIVSHVRGYLPAEKWKTFVVGQADAKAGCYKE